MTQFIVHQLPPEEPHPTTHRRLDMRPLRRVEDGDFLVEMQPSVEDIEDNDVFEDEVRTNYPDLFDCLSNNGFDLGQFKLFSRKFLGNAPETGEKKVADTVQKEKAKIISVLAQNLYIMCTLTKDQIKNVTAFWKAMISFITPDAERTAERSM